MYEQVNAAEFDKEDTDPNGYVYQRVLLGIQNHWTKKTLTFFEFKSSEVFDKTSRMIPLDRDDFDVDQAFLEHDLEAFKIKLGRQVLGYGSLRLISSREGPNSRLSFDLVKAYRKTEVGQYDVFVGSPVEIERFSFNNSPEKDQVIWGTYFAFHHGIDLYYIGLSKPSVFNRMLEHESRQSVGVRWWGGSELDYNFEAVLQGGEFGDRYIQAWTIASETGWNVPGRKDKLRLGLRADVALLDGLQ